MGVGGHRDRQNQDYQESGGRPYTVGWKVTTSSVQKPHASGICNVTQVGPSEVLKWFTVPLLSSLLVGKAELEIQCAVVAQ